MSTGPNGQRFNEDYIGSPHEWRWISWVDWRCARCGCVWHGSDTAACGKSEAELREMTPNDKMTVYRYGSAGYQERTCDEWVEHDGGEKK